jgi:Poly(3-hydroxybutyrate) depolymerase
MNKKIILLLIFLFGLFIIVRANPVKHTLQFGGYEREYLLYVPSHTEKPRGIIVCLHGFNGSMNVFFNSYDISGVADQANYILLAPQALPEQSSDVINWGKLLGDLGFDIRLEAAWGCGTQVSTSLLGQDVKIELNKNIDDIGFIRELIRLTSETNDLQTEDVFVLGTSLGGYMAYQLALAFGNELNGIISIAGSMGLAIKNQDNQVKVPVCDFQSLTDEVVPYDGKSKIEEGFFSFTVQLAWAKTDVLDFWVKKNGITSSPVTEIVDYYPSGNGITAEKITYSDVENEVIHYRTNGAPHSYFFKKENGDCMDMREEVAKFIQAHASLDPNSIMPPSTEGRAFYPNPVQNRVYFTSDEGCFSLFALDGKLLLSDSFTSAGYDFSGLRKGMYIIRIQTGNQVQTAKLIKQ